jgi:hypothetical protein
MLDSCKFKNVVSNYDGGAIYIGCKWEVIVILF